MMDEQAKQAGAGRGGRWSRRRRLTSGAADRGSAERFVCEMRPAAPTVPMKGETVERGNLVYNSERESCT